MDTTKPGKDFFAEFPPVSKDAWLQKIAKDLKDKPLDDLNWQVSDAFVVSPFAHADDFKEPPLPLFAEPGHWEICEDVPATDPVVANRQTLEALQGGAGGIRFYLDGAPDRAFFTHLFDGIYADFIGLHFTGPGVTQNPGAVLAGLETLAKANNITTSSLRGTMDFDPASGTAGIVDWRYLADLMEYARDRFPGFRLVTIGPGGRGAVAPNATVDIASPLQSGEGPEAGLTALLQHGNGYLQNLTQRGVPAAEAAGTLQFSMVIGQSYFLEIARIRAFKLLWLNVLKAWGAPLKYPVLSVYFQPGVYTDDLYTNMIRATTMAMSAVLGGGDRLTVLPYDAGRETLATYPQAFGRRIARNVQHLLKMESGFDQLTDPAAGSYYIEKLTLQLAEQAWRAFCM